MLVVMHVLFILDNKHLWNVILSQCSKHVLALDVTILFCVKGMRTMVMVSLQYLTSVVALLLVLSLSLLLCIAF